MELVGFILVVFLYGLLVGFLRRKKLWFPYYALAVFGLTFLLVYLARWSNLEEIIASWEMAQTHFLTRSLGLSTQVISSSSIAVQSKMGWSILSIGLECSAVLELSVLISLIIFYPAFSYYQKGVFLAVGLAATYLINLLRLLLIVTLVAVYGSELVFVAHTVIGRIFFFTAVVVFYWYLITAPTLGWLWQRAKRR